MPKSVRRRIKKRTTKRKSSYKVRHRNVRRVKKQTKKKYFKGGHPPEVDLDCNKLLLMESDFIKKYDDFLTFIDKFRGFESIEDITNILPNDQIPDDPKNMNNILLDIIKQPEIENKKPVEIIALFTAKFHQDLLDEVKLNIENNKYEQCYKDPYFLQFNEILNCIQPETAQRINTFISDIKKFKKEVIDYIKDGIYTIEGFNELKKNRKKWVTEYHIIEKNNGGECGGLMGVQQIMDYIRIACNVWEITLDTGECIDIKTKHIKK